MITDNGARYRPGDFARIVGIQTRASSAPSPTHRHNGNAERYRRIIAEEVLYAREYTAAADRNEGSGRPTDGKP